MASDTQPEQWKVIKRTMVYAREQGVDMEVFFDFLYELGVRDLNLDKVREGLRHACREWDI